MASILAAQEPQWSPGAKHGYHTVTLGWYQNELIRRTDSKKRSIGEFFQDEIATKLGVEYYIGLPNHIDEARVSTTIGFHRTRMLAHLHELPPMMVLSGIWPRSAVAKSVRVLPVSNPADIGNSPYREVEIPSANGFGQAIAVAKIYDVLSRGGKELGIDPWTWREIVSPAFAPPTGTHDAILKLDTKYSFGFSRPSKDFKFGSDSRAFGCPGAGGSFGMGDPTSQLSFAYLPNRMGFRLFDDPREKALRDACYESLAAMTPRRRAA